MLNLAFSVLACLVSGDTMTFMNDETLNCIGTDLLIVNDILLKRIVQVKMNQNKYPRLRVFPSVIRTYHALSVLNWRLVVINNL